MQLASIRGVHTVTAETVQGAVARLDVESMIPSDSSPVVVKSAPLVSPSTKSANVFAYPSLPSAVVPPPVKTGRQPNAFLSYNTPQKVNQPAWSIRTAILAALVLSGILALAVLGRSESRKGIAPGIFSHSSDALGDLGPGGPFAGYDAAPEDIGDGQVLTVAAGPGQTIKDLSLRYAGHFDSDLSARIRSLNPDLRDPDHLEAGQLIRIPLPSGALRKANDTQDRDGSTNPGNYGSLFGRLTALLRERK